MELPVGISDFRKLVEYRNRYTGESYLYVDKTSFIKEIDHDGTEVIVITRPRRFGKTINMSMLHYFYAPEVDSQNTAGLFNGLEISKYPDAMKGQGSCPVVLISFKDIAKKLAEIAIKQLSGKGYKQELVDAGCEKVISLGIGFTKNKVCVLEAK